MLCLISSPQLGSGLGGRDITSYVYIAASFQELSVAPQKSHDLLSLSRIINLWRVSLKIAPHSHLTSATIFSPYLDITAPMTAAMIATAPPTQTDHRVVFIASFSASDRVRESISTCANAATLAAFWLSTICATMRHSCSSSSRAAANCRRASS